MEETRQVAVAYYSNSPDEIKTVAKGVFDDMDKDRDLKVSRKEFERYLKRQHPKLKPAIFHQFDKDGDGFLDIEDVIVFYYMIKFRPYWCRSCNNNLHSVFFICRECFLKDDVYSLCLTCYRFFQFNHEHEDFADNHAILTDMRCRVMKKKYGGGPSSLGKSTGGSSSKGKNDGGSSSKGNSNGKETHEGKRTKWFVNLGIESEWCRIM